MPTTPPAFAIGDAVLRISDNEPPERLRVSALTEHYVIAGPFRFDRLTLAEVTDFGLLGASYLVVNDSLNYLNAMTAAAQDLEGGYR